MQYRVGDVPEEGPFDVRTPIAEHFVGFGQGEPQFTAREAILDEMVPLYHRLNIDANELMHILWNCEAEARRIIARGESPESMESYVAILLLYTAEFSERSESFYSILNRVLRERDSDAVRSVSSVIWILLWALNYCPAYAGRVVFRGVRGDLTADYHDGREFTWHAFSSCFCRIHNPQFLGQEGIRTLFVIELTTNRARAISRFSFQVDENEIVLPPNCRFRVVGNPADMGNGLTEIHLREIEPDDPILLFDDDHRILQPIPAGLTSPEFVNRFSGHRISIRGHNGYLSFENEEVVRSEHDIGPCFWVESLDAERGTFALRCLAGFLSLGTAGVNAIRIEPNHILADEILLLEWHGGAYFIRARDTDPIRYLSIGKHAPGPCIRPHRLRDEQFELSVLL